jgi:hypothetical protein
MASKKDMALAVREDALRGLIYTVRGVQVMLDRDLAQLYHVETRALKQAVKRNRRRFPENFMFVLNASEVEMLVSQPVMPSRKHFADRLC